jgi:hypothetical protein
MLCFKTQPIYPFFRFAPTSNIWRYQKISNEGYNKPKVNRVSGMRDRPAEQEKYPTDQGLQNRVNQSAICVNELEIKTIAL